MPWVASPSRTHLAVGEALDEVAELVKIAERLGGLGHQPADAIVDGERALLGAKQASGKAGRLLVDVRFPVRFLGVLGVGPALLADQRHEGDGAEILFLETVFAGAGDPQQGLVAMLADGDHEPAAKRELLFQRLGHPRTTGRDDDRLVRRFVDPAL